MPKYARRVDANQKQIVACYRAAGWTVEVRSGLGEGELDLRMTRGKRTMEVEVKDGSKPASARRLRVKQIETLRRKDGIERYVVESIEDALLTMDNAPYAKWHTMNYISTQVR